MRTRSKLTWLLGSVLGLALTLPLRADNGIPPAPTKEPELTSLKGYVSPWVKEVLKLADAGMDELVLQAFIDGAGTFNLTSEQIVQLHELQVPPVLVSAMLQHDTELAAGLRPEPGPPPAPAPLLDKQAKPPMKPIPVAALSTPPAVTKTTATEPETIVNKSPADSDDLWLELGLGYADYDFAPEDPAPDGPIHWPKIPEQYTVVSRSASPVRKPFPVQLTSPILVFKAAGRSPNIVLLESFP